MKSQLCHLGEDFGLVLVHFAFLEQDARDWEFSKQRNLLLLVLDAEKLKARGPTPGEEHLIFSHSGR